VAYYYVRYGSVLAFLSDRQNGFVKRISADGRLRQVYPDDELLMQNVEDNEATCDILYSESSP
jgi:hypothetical protein